jgi:hypothetical protein
MSGEGLSWWMINGDRGVSSNKIVEIMEGYQPYSMTGVCGIFQTHPLDPSDFNRCYALLESVPEYRDRLKIMRYVSAEWRVLVDNWYELENLLLEELPSGKAPKLYDKMWELFDSVRTS